MYQNYAGNSCFLWSILVWCNQFCPYPSRKLHWHLLMPSCGRCRPGVKDNHSLAVVYEQLTNSRQGSLSHFGEESFNQLRTDDITTKTKGLFWCDIFCMADQLGIWTIAPRWYNSVKLLHTKIRSESICKSNVDSQLPKKAIVLINYVMFEWRQPNKKMPF